MATPLEALQNRKNTLSSSLGSSNTAYMPDTIPSPKDLSTDKQLSSVNKQIDDLRSKNLRTTWYGPEKEDAGDTGGSDDGLFMSGLKALSKPLNAIAGTVQYATGKGVKPGLGENINEATKTGLTFGNILQQSGAPRGVQVPLGFALDVMFDPVNWLTAGTSALIPRAGVGLVKGGAKSGIKGALEGFTSGVKSGVQKDAVSLMKLMPFTKKIAEIAPAAEKAGLKTSGFTNMMSKGATKYREATENLGKKAIENADKYDEAIGTTVMDRINKRPFGFQVGTLGDTIEEVIKKVPSTKILGKSTPTGDEIVDFFKYSPKKASEIADLKDKVINLARDKGVILTRNEEGSHFEKIDDFLKPDAVVTLPDKLGETMEVAIRDADGIVKSEFADKVKVYDSIENAKTLLETAGEDYNLKNLIEAYKVTPVGKTGVQWYDNAIDRLKSTTIDDIVHGRLGTGEEVVETVKKEADDLVKTWNSYNGIKDLKPLGKLLDAQQSFISIFKSAKVPMNLASHVVSHIGNFFMGTMMGLPMWKSEYFKAMMQANDLVKGKLGANGFKEMFFSDVNSLISMADNNPTRFKQLTGLDPKEIASKLSAEEKITNVLRSGSTADEVLKVLQEAAEKAQMADVQVGELSNMKNIAEEAADIETKSKLNKQLMKEGLGSYPTPSEQLSKMLKEAPVTRGEEFGSFTTSEITHNARFEQLKSWLAKESAAKPYNVPLKLANGLVNTMPRWYEHIDQTFKLGTSTYLTKIGLTEEELKIISRTVPFTKDDILEPIIKDGEKLYRLTQLKAAEVATEAFMNYAAMPDFVRVMRALPVLGSPFMSFPYAMAVKTAKTAINNPAIFNKVGFMINEMNANRSPQEKDAMEETYNEYLKAPTVVKLFGMWNTNVKNLIPYYQMNMFNPSQRDFGDSTQGKVVQMMDKFPIMQDPIGGVIKDYFIQPWILSGSGETPQGQFGEPLYPSFDEQGKKIEPGLGTKAFYGGRAIAEAVVPGSLSYLGALNAPDILSPETINKIPSYGFRNLSNATQGRSSIGATTKEDAVRKTIRSLFGRTGLPAYTLDVTKTSD